MSSSLETPSAVRVDICGDMTYNDLFNNQLQWMTIVDGIKIICMCSEETHRFLERSLPKTAGIRLVMQEDPSKGLPTGCPVCLFEVESPLRGPSVLRRLARSISHGEILAFSSEGTVRLAVKSLKAGASDFFLLPAELESLRKEVFERLRKWTREGQSSRYLDNQKKRYDFRRILGESPGLKQVLGVAEKVIKARISPILIRGETGTGKELLARAIHFHIARPEEPFVEVDCGAIPEKLLESELFGYEKGAFTGATKGKKGLFETAHGGTLFLDEIGHLDPSLQVKLLRAIEYGNVRRLGGTKMIPVDIRIIAATNIDLEKAIEEGNFRQDMYYRLNVVSLRLPPLRGRGEDIVLLARHFLDRFIDRYGLPAKEFTPLAIEALKGHSWPGNIRELKNAIERAAILQDGELIDPAIFSFRDSSPGSDAASGDSPGRVVIEVPEEGISRMEVEKRLLSETLRVAGGNRSRAARMLDVSRPTLISMIKRHGLA